MRPPSRRWRAAGASLFLLGVACVDVSGDSDATGSTGDNGGSSDLSVWSPGSSADHETAHLSIWDFGPEPLCEGQVFELEAEAARLSAEMGLDISGPDKLRVAWGSDAAEELCEHPFPVNGCSRGLGVDAFVATVSQSASHELVHGIRNHHGLRTRAFFEEGLAEQLGGERPLGVYIAWRPPHLDAYGPQNLLELSDEEFLDGGEVYGDFYTLAAHFVTYLREEYGPDALYAFFMDVDETDVDETFSRVFGLSLADAESRWRNEAPPLYELGAPCREVVPFGVAGVEVEQTLDCDLTDSLGPDDEGLMWSTRGYCFDLAEARDVRVTLEALSGDASLIPYACQSETGGATSTGIGLGPQPTDYSLAACRWQIWLRGEAGSSVRVRVEPI